MMQAGSAKQVDLTTLMVRPVRDAQEQVEWDRLMDTHHYLGFRGMVGGENIGETNPSGERP